MSPDDSGWSIHCYTDYTGHCIDRVLQTNQCGCRIYSTPRLHFAVEGLRCKLTKHRPRIAYRTPQRRNSTLE